RKDTNCRADQVYDFELKYCVCPPGEALIDGQCSAEPDPLPPPDCSTAGPGIFSKTGPVISSDGANYVVTQGGGSACYGQCNHTLSESASSCYSSGEGTGFCNY